LYRQESDIIQTPLVGEGHLVELISTGAPLTHVLDKLCTALDVQVGDVVSLVLFSDDDEHYVHTIAQKAAQFGLFLFCSTAILSLSEELLGTFEMYCCFPRSPNPSESKLIERATHLAALAIQCHNYEQDSESFSLHWKDAIERSSREGPSSKN
jgi:hypothetical protein